MVRDLMAFIGTPTSAGSLAARVALGGDAVSALLAAADDVSEADAALRGGRWSVVLPVSASEPSMVDGGVGDRSPVVAAQCVNALRSASPDVTVEGLLAVVEESVASSIGVLERDLAGHWHRRQAIEPEADDVLRAELWPAVDASWSTARGDRDRVFVASEQLAEWLPGSPGATAAEVIACRDRNFVAAVWVTRLTVPPPGTPSTDEDA